MHDIGFAAKAGYKLECMRVFQYGGRKVINVLFALVLLTTFQNYADANEEIEIPRDAIYHYYDHDGIRQIGHNVPPEFVRHGYVVKSRNGMVLLRVEKALSEEEAKEAESRKAQDAEQRRFAKEQRERDQMLMRTFSSAEDAQRALDRKLAALDVIIDITRGNIIQLESEHDREQSKAAEHERAGHPVPEEIMQRLGEIQSQIDDAFNFVKIKEDEKAKVRGEYEKDIERLQELRGEKEA